MSSASEDGDMSFYDAQGGDRNGEAAEVEPSGAMTLSGQAQFHVLDSFTANAPNDTADSPATRRLKCFDVKARKRYSLPASIPACPATPEHLLAPGKRATLLLRRKGETASKELPVQVT